MKCKFCNNEVVTSKGQIRTKNQEWHKNCKKSFDRSEFQKWGRIGGQKSLNRFKGKTKKEISAIMQKVSQARIKPYKSGIKYLDKAVDIMK